MAHTALNPPAAAARAPVAIVSTSSLPGSRKWTCRSTRPGATTWPRTSRTSAPSGAPRPAFTAVILPSWMSTSAGWSKPRLGSITRPPLSSSGRIIPSRAWPRRRARDARPLDRLLDAAEAAHAQIFDAAGHEGIGTAHAHFGAELREAPDVGARDAGVQHVAHEADFQARDLAVLVADREQVEQRLGRVLVLAVARVHYVGADAVAEEFGGAGRGMADDHHVDPHRFQVASRIDQRLAFLDGAAARRHVDSVGGEPFFRELE